MTFIVTQDPLDTTVVDFWRMIVEHGVSTIVMLSELGCSPTQTKCHPYWPVNSELICEYVRVKFLKEESNDFYIRRDFEIFNAKVSLIIQVSSSYDLFPFTIYEESHAIATPLICFLLSVS